MKNISTLLICAFLALTSCGTDSVEGPPGPPGPEGPSGVNGFIGTAIDITGDFTAENDYTLSVIFDDLDVEVFESDAVLVYLKVGNSGTDANGIPIEIFTPIPQTYFEVDKTIQYNFNYTFEDVLIFLDGINSNGTLLNFGALSPDYRINKKFRIIVLPAAFAQTKQSNLDLTDMKAVMKALNMQESDVIK